MRKKIALSLAMMMCIAAFSACTKKTNEKVESGAESVVSDVVSGTESTVSGVASGADSKEDQVESAIESRTDETSSK